MENPYLPPANNQKRVFKTPLILPLSVLMVVAIYAGYAFVYLTGRDAGILSFVGAISFEVFLLCQIGMVSITLYNKKQLDAFLREFPALVSRSGLETLKPIVRTNMYSSLFMIVFLALAALAAIMSILNHGVLKGVLVAVLSFATGKLINWYKPSEEKVKHIQCNDEELEAELNGVLQCWMHKPLPDF
jgi:hypothetical protein